MISRLIPALALLCLVATCVVLGLTIDQGEQIADQGDRITKVERAVTKRCKDACRDAIFRRLRRTFADRPAPNHPGSGHSENAISGGGGTQTSAPPEQQPDPPSGGSPETPNGGSDDEPPSGGNQGGGNGTQPTPAPGQPPAESGLLDPVIDPLAPGNHCHVEVTAPGVQLTVCN